MALPPHPRLLARPGDWIRLARQRETDAPSRAFWEALRHRADGLLGTPVLERVMTGRRLLMVSREALDRISVLAIVANVSGLTRYADRARAEMLAVARFTDWNPSHFLDTAEMSLALAIGYDWLFDRLSPAKREEIRTALVEKGLRPSLDSTAPHNWWHDTPENWNQVCHGGLGAAAIALAEDEPVLAEEILQRALAKLPIAAAAYAPDGVYPEGPMYWTYGSSYHVMLCAALLRLVGKSWGLDAFEGFAQSAGFFNEVTAPSGRFFNFGDCSDRRRLQAPLFWMARHFRQPGWIRHDLRTLDAEFAEYRSAPSMQYGHYDMLAIAWLWHDPALGSAPPEAMQRNWHGDGTVPVAVLRNGDLYLAAKGGSASAGHAHMDAGSFILESQGVRWAVDPGMQDYESLERARLDLWNQQQDSERWSIFRLGPDAHSILRFDGAPQRVAGTARLLASGDETVFDLSSTCAPSALRVYRTFRMVGDGVLLEDEWTAAKGTQRATWQFMTEADATISGCTILLRQAGASLLLEVLDPAEIDVWISDVSMPRRPYDAPNPGLKRIEVSCDASFGRIRVLMSPTPRGDD